MAVDHNEFTQKSVKETILSGFREELGDFSKELQKEGKEKPFSWKKTPEKSVVANTKEQINKIVTPENEQHKEVIQKAKSDLKNYAIDPTALGQIENSLNKLPIQNILADIDQQFQKQLGQSVDLNFVDAYYG
jgi:hypothetical protein